MGNMDGDREDNSYKPLSEPGVIRINTNTITFARSGLQKNELKVGDGVRICNEDFIVTQLRGRVITGTDDFKHISEADDLSSEITSATADNYRRRIKEAVLNTRHTQNCGTMHPGTAHSAAAYQGAIAAGDGAKDPTFTKSQGDTFDINRIVTGSRVYVWCTGADAGLFKSTTGASTQGNNNYGYLEDGVYRDGGRFLTVKSYTATVLSFEERIGHAAATCFLKVANDHTVYRHLTTQARPNGDWEKWKGDFKGTNTRPGRGPTMNNYEQSTYERLGKDFSAGDSLGLGDYGQDEGHFYMECSNQGLCDRKTGLCECFDGYTGRACQRQSCPEDCSGHGVCMSVDQLRTAEMTKLDMTCYTKRDDKVVSCDSDVLSNKLRANDYVKIGNFPPMKIATISTAGVNLVRFVAGAGTTGAKTFKIAEDTRTGVVDGMKAYKNGDVLLGTLDGNAAEDGSDGDTVTLVANLLAAIEVGDKVTFKAAASTDNYNTTHFLSGLTPTNNAAHKVDTFTLYNGFPETTPYGTEIYQVHAYDLWDADKNMACKCDPRWTGYDCSERKCPLGDDPLTVDAVDGQGTTTTTDDSAYTQSPEKQTLVINSGQTEIGSATSVPTGMLVGHFSLAFEDYFGETFVTKPIPLEVEMSVTVSAASGGLVVLFDGAAGLPVSELSRGDEVRIGKDIRFVETITFVDHNTKTHIKSFKVRDEYLGATIGGENFHNAHPSGSRLHRRDVSKEIRQALLNLPNARIEGVSVEKLEISGDYVGVDAASYGVIDSIATFGKTSTASATTIEDNWKAGDLIRIRSMVRIVTGVAANEVQFHGSMGTSANAFQLPYRAAMQKYRIKFESGCLTDDHCNHNGINSYDSDAGATCSLGGSCYCSLPSVGGLTVKATGTCDGGTDIGMTSVTNDVKAGMKVMNGNVLLGYVSSVNAGTKVVLTANCPSSSVAANDMIAFTSTENNQYHGFGCTRKGKGNDFHGTPRAINHARPYKRSNSGDIPLMQCDKDELFSGKILNTYGEVSKASTTKISFTNGAGAATAVDPAADISVGNELYIDGQVRTVVEKDSANKWVKVDLPFTIYAKSDDDFVVPAGSTVYLIHRLGGVGSMCSLTDMPKITSTELANTLATGSLKTISSGGSTVDGDQTLSSQTNPHTEITVRTMDPQEIEIGDRIRVDTEATTTNVLSPGTFITHTVDRIYYETLNADSATPTQNGAIAKFTLNEIVSVETSTTGAMAKVDDSVVRAIYNDQRGTTENKECSGRGLCDEASGLCQCFKGYTDDDCSRQNALSAN